MEQIQPFKKRLVEQQTYYSTPSYNATPTRRPTHHQIQYIHYVPTNECNQETIKQSYTQNNNNQQQQQGLSQSTDDNKFQIYEPPMTLNAWTQTNSDEFQPVKNSKEATLLARIKQLEDKVKFQSAIIDKWQQTKIESPSEVQIVSQSNSNLNAIPVEYRIINKIDGTNNETQIEIEISDDNSHNTSNETTETVALDQKENAFVEHMYAQIAKSPINDPNPKPQKKPLKADGSYISIGPNNTKVLASEFEKLTWTSPSIATRKLLGFIFDREILATHSMTGKASPAFKDLNKPIKNQLDPKAIEDIVYAVTSRCKTTSKEVRSSITTKCADENKMMKLKALKNAEARRSILTDINGKENNQTLQI